MYTICHEWNWNNVALTEQGYNKIYEYEIRKYEDEGWQEEKHFTAEELLKDNE